MFEFGVSIFLMSLLSYSLLSLPSPNSEIKLEHLFQLAVLEGVSVGVLFKPPGVVYHPDVTDQLLRFLSYVYLSQKSLLKQEGLHGKDDGIAG